MSETTIPANLIAPIVRVRDGAVYASSLDVAAFFGKRHDHVVRDVRKILADQPDFSLPNFGEISAPDSYGRPQPAFDMTRDGFTLLVMGFTGKRAAEFKIRYIQEFGRMEAALKTPTLPDLSDPIVLQGLLSEHLTKRIEAEQRAAAAEKAVEAAKPKTEFYDTFSSADGLYGLQNAARVLDQPPNKFIGFLKAGYLFYQGGALVPKVQYREMRLFEVKSTIVDDKARYQTYVTPKGIQYFAKKLNTSQENAA